jgi:DNA ligase (NAD+)
MFNKEEIITDPIKYGRNVSNKKLETLLRYLSDQYHNKGISIVPDEIFDSLKEILEKKDPDNKFLSEVGNPIDTTKRKYKLPFIMPSLNKIKNDELELKKWINKYKGCYSLSDKLDGVSAQLFKNSKGKFKLFTRGNGIYGHDISALIEYVINQDVLFDKIPNETSIRGELIISKENFKSISDIMANARNTVSGLVNSKTIDPKIAYLTEFVAYNVLNPLTLYKNQYNKLEDWGFNTVTYKFVNNIDIDLLYDYLKKRRKGSPFEIDGIVVADNSEIYEISETNPQHAFAFKAILDDQISEAIIKKIIWTASMDGYLKPKIEITPINLLGTVIKFATAFNAKFIVDNKLGPGAIIKIIRSGDVIPYIKEVIKSAKKPQMPDQPYIWNKTMVDILLKNKDSDDVNIKIIEHFFKTLEVKYIGEGIITKLVENGYNTIENILEADEEDLKCIDGLGDTIITKIFDSIKQSLKNTNLYTFMAASHLFGRGLGRRKIKLVTDVIPNILTTTLNKDKLYEKIMDIDGFSNISTEKFIDNLNKFKKFYDSINEIYDISHLLKEKIIIVGDMFKNMNIVLSGTRNKELETFIIKNGGKLTTSVSGKTSLLVYEPEKTGSKLEKAKEAGIEMITVSNFIKKYMSLYK